MSAITLAALPRTIHFFVAYSKGIDVIGVSNAPEAAPMARGLHPDLQFVLLAKSLSMASS